MDFFLSVINQINKTWKSEEPRNFRNCNFVFNLRQYAEFCCSLKIGSAEVGHPRIDLWRSSSSNRYGLFLATHFRLSLEEGGGDRQFFRVPFELNFSTLVEERRSASRPDEGINTEKWNVISDLEASLNVTSSCTKLIAYSATLINWKFKYKSKSRDRGMEEESELEETASKEIRFKVALWAERELSTLKVSSNFQIWHQIEISAQD